MSPNHEPEPVSRRVGEMTVTLKSNLDVDGDMEGGLETYTFTERDGRTTLVSVGHFDSVESRDAAIASGMEKGAAETWDRLAELLQSQRGG